MKSTGMIKARLNGIKGDHSLRYLCLALLLSLALTAIFVTPLWADDEGLSIPISVENGGAEPPVLLTNDQQNPTIIALPDKNKWFVVWEDWRNASTTGTDIYGRFINNDGTLCGDEIAISTAPGNQTVPVLAYRDTPAGNDNIMIAWQDSRGAYASGYVYYKIFNISSLTPTCSSGSILGNERSVGYRFIGDDHLLSRKLPKIAYDKARDKFWMVWVEGRSRLQRLIEDPFNGIGSPHWQFADSNYVAYTTVSADKGYVLTPEVLRNTDSYSSRTVRLLSSTSKFDEKGGTVKYIYEYFTDINNVTVACDDSSPEALIAWEGIRGKATLTSKWEEKDDETVEECHYEYELDDEGNLVRTEVCEDVPNPDYGVPTLGDHYSSELVEEYDSGVTHIYSIFDKYINQPVVHSQLIDTSDAPSYYPALGYDSIHRKFLVAWEDRSGLCNDVPCYGAHSMIFGQLLYTGGGLYGPNFPISYQDLNGDGALDDDIMFSNQTRPNVCLDLTNQRFFVTWQDGRNSGIASDDLDIYGQWVDSEGSLRGYNYAICVEEDNQYNPVTAYNQANHQFMTVWKDARNLNITNSDIYGQRYTSEQQAQFILKNGVYVAPPSLDFSSCEIDSSAVLDVVISNSSGSEIVVVSAATGTEVYSVSGITAGDILAVGATVTCQVTFKPTAAGSFDDVLMLDIGGAQFSVPLRGTVNNDFNYTDIDSFTADRDYRLSISASTDQTGQLYVIFSHNPLSAGNIYALAQDGTLKPFPYLESSGWQDIWHLESAHSGLELDLSTIDFRPLGCSACQGEAADTGDDDFHFGGIIITPPGDTAFNNATDFKYMPGTLYMGTYVKDASSSSGAFDFNVGMLEIQSFNINSLAGTWQLTSRYNNENRVHPTNLVVSETGDGNISAVWPGYNVFMMYGTDDSGEYWMGFSIGAYQYIYQLKSLTENTFSGTYSCIVNGEYLLNEPVCGVRVGSGLDNWLCSEMEIKVADGDPIPDGEQAIAIFSGNDSMNTRPFKTSGPWEIQWDVNGNMFGITIYASDGTVVDVISNSSNKGASYQTRTGEYYLGTAITGSWNIKIVSMQ